MFIKFLFLYRNNENDFAQSIIYKQVREKLFGIPSDNIKIICIDLNFFFIVTGQILMN